MKKIDKLILKAFLGPFVLTTSIVVFIFLLRFLMMYFNDFIGKDLGLDVFGKLFAYFSLITVPTALPLAILLATLMTFGNLGEHTELTALKSAGIPISRMIRSTFIFTAFVGIFCYFYNDKVTPWANLKGYSLLWDVKTTKVTLNIQEGIFYKEIPGYRIKVQKKFPDNKTMKNILIYDHSNNTGNKNLTIADSGKMYTMQGGSYLIFELFNGKNYLENNNSFNSFDETQFTKNTFKKNKIVFSLESFGIKRTNEEQFRYHEYMKDTKELNEKIDSTYKDLRRGIKEQTQNIKSQNAYILNTNNFIDSTRKPIVSGSWINKKYASLNNPTAKEEILHTAVSKIKSVKSQLETDVSINTNKLKEIYRADVEKWHKITIAFSCLVMYLIGAALGSIIKKGGFGMPVLVSVSFFIFYYVLMQLGDKYAKEGIIPVIVGVWIPCGVLTIIAVYLAYKATNDSNLFENNNFEKLRVFVSEIKAKYQKSSVKARV